MGYVAQTYNLTMGAFVPIPLIVFPNASASPLEGYYCFFDGTYCLAFMIGYGNNQIICIKINPVTLQWCIYSNVAHKTTFNGNCNDTQSFCRQLGKGLYLWNDGDGRSGYFRVPDYFAPGQYIVVPQQSFLAVNPCGGGTLNATYYDGVKNILAYEFSDNHPISQNYWINICKATNNGVTSIANGYLGNFPSNTDPFVKQSFAFPFSNSYSGAANGLYAYDQNGAVYFFDVRQFPHPYFFGYGVPSIVYNNLSCSVPNNGQSYVTLQQSWMVQESLVGLTTFAGTQTCGAQLPLGTAMFAGGGGTYTRSILFATPNYGVMINSNRYTYEQGAWYCGNGLFCQMGNYTPYGTAVAPGFYVGTVPGFVPPSPNNARRNILQLTNFHRPVSVFGAYKT